MLILHALALGLGGLAWNDVKELIEASLGSSDTKVIVYQPQTNVANLKSTQNSTPVNMTAGRATLVGLIDRYLKALLDPYISLLEVHKLMYFVQESGQDLRLNYKKASYGPYADNLRHVLNAIEGHLIDGYADGGDEPNKQISLVINAATEANHFLQKHPDTINNFDRVTQLVDGFETSFGLELLSTVHWLVSKEQANSIQSVINEVYSWNNHKKQFSTRQIMLAIDRLEQQSWIPVLSRN